MKLKRFLFLTLVLTLLISLLPAAVSAVSTTFPNLDLSTATAVDYDTVYTEQFTTVMEPHIFKFVVPENGLVTFALDMSERTPGTRWNLNFDLYTEEDISYSFWRSETDACLSVDGVQTLSFGLAPDTYYAVMYYDYLTNDYCQSGETIDVTYALSFAASNQCEKENQDVTITPGYAYTGFCGNDDRDNWNFTIPTTYTAQIYIANMDAIWEGNDPDTVIFFLHHKEDHRVHYLNPTEAYTDANGDKYFLCQFVPGNYTLEIWDRSHTQTPYAVAIIPTVAVTKQPSSVKVAPGAKATVSVSATGEGLTYKWYHKNAGDAKFTLAKSMTGKSYSCTMSNSADGRQVYCVITDKYGNSVKTKTVTLSLKFGITKQPVNTTVPKNKTAKVSVSAEGDGLKYQWYYKDRSSKKFKVSSTKTSTYSVKMTSSKNGRQVYCVIKDKHGNTFKTSTVTLKMAPKVKITKQPSSSFKVNAGKKVSVTVKASGDGLTYQWYYKNKGSSSYKKISGATAATYSVTMSASVSGRKVYCVVKDKYGQTVKSKTSTLYAKTTIVEHPSFTASKDGKKVTVSISAAGEKLTYKWYYKNPGAKKFTRAKSAKGSTYSFTNNSSAKGRQVYCVITSKYGGSVKTGTITISSASKCGKSLYWSWNTNGTLAITGSGPMYDYEEGKAPWNSIKSRIKTVIIDSGVTTIGARAFKGCSNLTSVSLPSTLTDIREWAFTHCKKLTTISIPNGVKTIGAYAFSACVNLKYIVLSDALQRIDEWAFNSCHSMKYVYLGRKLTRIHNGAFSQCDALTKLFYGGTEDTWLNLRIDANNLELTQASRKYVTSRNKLPV